MYNVLCFSGVVIDIVGIFSGLYRKDHIYISFCELEQSPSFLLSGAVQ